jgi:hypothetical protein
MSQAMSKHHITSEVHTMARSVSCCGASFAAVGRGLQGNASLGERSSWHSSEMLALPRSPKPQPA